MTKEQLEFCSKFERDHGDSITMLTLCRVDGTPEQIRSTGLLPLPGKIDLWGLLIIGGTGLHFYAHPSASPLMSLFKAAPADPSRGTQHLGIPYDSVRVITVPELQKRQFWRLFSGVSDLRISVAYTAADGSARSLAVLLPDSNTDFLDLLRQKAAEYSASDQNTVG